MKNIIGMRFNSLIVLKMHHKEQLYLNNGVKNGFKYFYLCKCDCGNNCVVSYNHLISNHTKSCGCLNFKHNLTNSRLFKIWSGILNRCYNKNNHKYKNYGGRGITICDEWKNDFKVFYDWSITNSYQDNLTIDRIDVNGNYEPSNCRWVNQKTQQNNKNSNLWITYDNQTYTLSEWSEILNINYYTLKSRLRYKWSIEKSFTTPVQHFHNPR